jgi:hypothetical protein
MADDVVKLSERLDNHSKRLANHDEVLVAMAKLVDTLKAAVDAQRKIFEGLQRAVAEKTGEPPAKPGPVN